MIPKFDNRGLLPEGVHLCTLAELRVWASSVPDAHHRLALLDRFESFLKDVIAPIASGWPIVIDGSFVTDKKKPNDIDFALDLRDCRDEKILGCAYIALMIGHQSNMATYLVDGYPILPCNNDFQAFFCYIGQKTAQVKNLDKKDRKGILRIEQW